MSAPFFTTEFLSAIAWKSRSDHGAILNIANAKVAPLLEENTRLRVDMGELLDERDAWIDEQVDTLRGNNKELREENARLKHLLQEAFQEVLIWAGEPGEDPELAVLIKSIRDALGKNARLVDWQRSAAAKLKQQRSLLARARDAMFAVLNAKASEDAWGELNQCCSDVSDALEEEK